MTIGADLKAYGHSQDHFIAAGENIAEGFGDKCYGTPEEAVETGLLAFLDEDRNYRGGFSDATGHWSQMVWKSTKYVGCAWAARDNFMTAGDSDKPTFYVVCSYFPP